MSAWTLSAGSTIRGVAGSAASITLTVFGDEKSTTDLYDKLYQGQVPAVAGILYTVPLSTQAVISTLVLANTTAGAVTVTLYVDGTADSNRVFNATIPANGEAIWAGDGWQVLDATGATLVTTSSSSPTTLTGDVTGVGVGIVPTTLATVNGNVGTFGSASNVAQVTANGKGLTTAVANVPIAVTSAAVTDFNEAAQDAVGTILVDTATVDLTYADATPSITADVINDSITNSKLANMGGHTIKGNNTGVSADPLDLSIAQVQAELGTTGTNTGDVTLTASGAVANANAATLAGQALTLQPASAAFAGLLTAAQFTKLANTSGTNTGDQNLFLSVTGNTGTATADTTTDSLAITGTGVISTAATDTPDGLVITSAALTGDVTTVGAAATIAANAVTTGKIINDAVDNTKLNNMPAHTFKGNNTAGSADPLDLSIAQVQAELGTSGTNTGDVSLAAVGAVANANAATLTGQVLNLQPASASFPGVITSAQFVILSNTSGTNSGNVSLGAVGASPNANGATLTGQALNLELASASFPGLVTAAQFTKLANTSGTNTGDQTITLTGPVTGSGTGSFATTITPDAVTNAMLADAAANTMKGNYTGSSDNPTDGALTANQFFARSSAGNIAAKSITDAGLAWAALSTVAAETAALDLATVLLKGLMSPADKIRMGQALDAAADFGFVGDLITTCVSSSNGAGDASITAATTLLTCTSAPFVSTDVGKRITIPGAGASGAQFTGTIASFVSATQVNVNTTVGTTVAAKNINFGTDNTTACNNLMTFVNTTHVAGTFRAGTKLIFGESQTNAYGIPIPLVFNQTMQIEGVGGGHTADTGDYSRIGGTRLAWWGTSPDGGTAFGAVITFTPTGVQSLKRVALRSCWIDCRNNDQNNGLIGLKLASCQGWSLEDFFVMDPMAIGVWFDIASSPTEARDCTRGLATNLMFRVLDNTTGVTLTPTTTTSAVNISTAQTLTLAAANGIRSGSDYIWVQTAIGRPFLARYTGGGGTTSLTGVVCAAEDAVHVPTTVSGSNVVQCSPSNAMAMYLNGGTGANTCCNTFLEVAISHGGSWGPAAIEFGNSDSNDFQSLYINGGTRAVFGAAPNNRMTKPGVRQNGSNVSNSLASRNNTFKGGDPGSLPTTNGGLECMGLLNTGALLVAPSGPTYWEAYQMGNGAPVPVVETGASLFWSGNGMFREGGLNALTANQALTAAVANVVNGCSVVVPPQGWQLGTWLRWRAVITKTAVGTSWTANIRQHSSLTAGGGTLIATAVFTATAAIDDGWVEIDMTCNAKGGSATALARYRLYKNAIPTAGFSTGVVAPVTSPSPIVTAATPGGTTFEGVMTMTGFNGDAPAGGPTFLFLEIVPTTAATVMTVLPPSGVQCIKAANP